MGRKLLEEKKNIKVLAFNGISSVFNIFLFNVLSVFTVSAKFEQLYVFKYAMKDMSKSPSNASSMTSWL